MNCIGKNGMEPESKPFDLQCDFSISTQWKLEFNLWFISKWNSIKDENIAQVEQTGEQLWNAIQCDLNETKRGPKYTLSLTHNHVFYFQCVFFLLFFVFFHSLCVCVLHDPFVNLLLSKNLCVFREFCILCCPLENEKTIDLISSEYEKKVNK